MVSVWAVISTEPFFELISLVSVTLPSSFVVLSLRMVIELSSFRPIVITEQMLPYGLIVMVSEIPE